MSHYDLETKCLHSGYTPKKGEPCALPIYQSTTFKYDTTDEMGQLFDLKAEGYFYTRLQNPTNDAVAAKIADLEGGVAGLLTSSGQAANFYAIFNICEAGDHVVAASTIYGGTFNLLGVTLKKLGIDCTFVDTDASAEEIAAAFKPNTKVLFAETIANPALVILDIEKFAKVAHEHEVPLIVDNTFATPINCRPFEWGADIVTHSTTKYMDKGRTCGVISFELTGGRDAAVRFMDGLKLANIATHVAASKTMVLHPASHTHRQMNDEQLREAGVSPGMIRLSVGIESAKDIINDLKEALENA